MSETRIPPCRRVAKDQPRAVKNRHQPSCVEAVASDSDDSTDDYEWPADVDAGHAQCPGCRPCWYDHCNSCGHRHAANTCPECVALARGDLAAISEMCGFPLLEEVLLQGIESEAAMLLAPSAVPEAWGNRHMSAILGRLCKCHARGRTCPADLPVPRVCPDAAAYLEDARDESHPGFVLSQIEDEWRVFLDQPSDLRHTIPRSIAYIGRHMHEIAHWDTDPSDPVEPPEFDAAKRALAGLRSHLEDVLSSGDRPEKGAPCVQCGKTMERVVTDEGAQDSYRCPGCRRTVSGDQYRYAVGVAYLAHADKLTVADLQKQYGVKRGSVTGWAAAGKVKRRGKDHNGLQLYDVADVLALHNGEATA